ncbi:leucine-rich repeat protein kinase family protein [Actinidia rufa]|uniref:Leucine-rich repeat protein kinase family protein n=1 Tax=Actinidia rufa TaxID=165716 RepID=A0A7J0G851_9ERIC|nr:leucine-rich repeat protein kinase family protein [Actinidia rufa]
MGLLCWVSALLLIVAISGVRTVCGNTELRALMEIKLSLDPDNKYLSSWTSDGDPCGGTFLGVACNEHWKVANISLQGKGLAGKVSPAVAELKCLSGLYLHYNALTGEIPREISNLTELIDLYLDWNNLSGTIPLEIGNMASLQVLDLCCNQLTGFIPTNMGSLKKLSVLALQRNRLNGPIPASLGDLEMLKILNLSFNQLSGFIPARLADIAQLEGLDVRNNTLSGVVPPSTLQPNTLPGFVKIGTSCNCCWGYYSHGCIRDWRIPGFHPIPKPASPLVSLEYSNGWDPFAVSHDGIGASYEFPPGFKFNLEDVESATQYFSDGNLLGKSNFSAVYKGILKDGSVVAVKSINVTCCKSEEAEFMKGLSLLTSLRHENLVKLRGFCCSKDRGECFLIYDFASKGNLLQYLDVQDGSSYVLDWPSRVSIISGIAKGIRYLHGSEPTKPAIVHQNVSVEKVLIDGNFDPLISDSGLLKLLADDVVFSALKVSAALGYMAPEYITTGRFTQKSDVYAFGVIILQILSGKSKLSHLMRLAAESCRLEDFIDPNLGGKFFDSEAAKLTEIALACTDEHPDLRPTLEAVTEELSKCGGTS